ncbi:uncharacterized protein LOC142620237 [Castanea sativa]|uniref:uncharacterized protein LOC142620237 n=1 Tax=Castanea sativa TaxID=21020 RepID=UPI003F64F749
MARYAKRSTRLCKKVRPVSDFDSKAFRRYCGDLGITNRYFTPAYLQGNGQAKAVNKFIVSGLKKRLDDSKGRWVEELSHVLWTVFNVKTSSFIPSINDSLLEKGLDLVEERRENAMVQLAYNQQKLKQGYNSHVKLRPLAPGDLVLRKVMGTAKNPAWEKLGSNWEGPYCITSIAGIGAYYLADLDEKVISSSFT